MKALVTAEINEGIISELEDYMELTFEGWGKELRKLTEDEMIYFLKDKEVLITSYDPITRKVIEACPNLKLIACTRANPVNIDIDCAKERNIPVIYTPGRNSDCTAEFTIALMLSIGRKIPMAYKSLKDGKYLSDEKIENKAKEGLKEDVTWALGAGTPYVEFKGTQLKSHTLGLLGYGSIGRRVASIARAFGMKIYIYDPFISEIELNDNAQTKVSLEKLLKESDFISCHCKVDESTRGLMGKEAFDMMKNTAYFINTSRGAIVDEEALIEALREAKIAGAAIDVFSAEPLFKNHPFVKELSNIVITPHLAGATYDAIDNHSIMIVQDIKSFLKGERMLHEYK
ncbi:2-hydroxyacid dehydrogenase [Clostridium sp. HMP27]|uniref:2-hydroxyacid dehydrogenase n=1 Tax=Clostridium sp. HMP27 TaxID=1487921 RepID=UPI00052DD8BD|nr:2-hydroxyacid dehydrogenase [Clostridium sp. HMP27]KGK86337.1 dihydrofolate reductase [Clostridium sp. HMP27]